MPTIELSVPASLALKAHMKWLVEDFEPRWLGRELVHSERLEILADLVEHFTGPEAPAREFARTSDNLPR
jgi:hypothetical protein